MREPVPSCGSPRSASRIMATRRGDARCRIITIMCEPDVSSTSSSRKSMTASTTTSRSIGTIVWRMVCGASTVNQREGMDGEIRTYLDGLPSCVVPHELDNIGRKLGE